MPHRLDILGSEEIDLPLAVVGGSRWQARGAMMWRRGWHVGAGYTASRPLRCTVHIGSGSFSAAEHRDRHGRTCFDTGRRLFACLRLSRPSSGHRITAATVPQKPAATASGRPIVRSESPADGTLAARHPARTSQNPRAKQRYIIFLPRVRHVRTWPEPEAILGAPAASSYEVDLRRSVGPNPPAVARSRNIADGAALRSISLTAVPFFWRHTRPTNRVRAHRVSELDRHGRPVP
jgi:hypothetical protein